MTFTYVNSFANLVGHDDPNEAIPRIISFSCRPDGWKFGRGKRPTISIIVNALLVSNMVMACSASKTGAFLNEDGSILVTGYYDQWHAEILCLLDGSYNLVIESNGEVIVDLLFSEIASTAQALTQQVKQCGGNVTPTFVYTASTTTTSILGDFKVAAFQNLPMIGEYQSFVSTAPLPQVVQYVNTREQNTHPLQTNRRFFGNSRAPTFQVAHA
jgi:hypothetical protein